MELVLQDVTKNFGGLRAASDVSFAVRDSVIFGLIGPNGAGKTTVFNLITGIYKPDRGAITFGAKSLTSLRPAQIAGVGIGRTFQNIRLFGQLTVIENLLVACELQKKTHLASAVLRLPSHYEDEATMREHALELLRVFDLQDMADEAPTSLSYGNQRRLEIARAMMLKPKLLLLDEPAAGMNYGEAEGLTTQVRWLRDTFDLSIVLVEHNMQVVMGVCEEIHVLDHGETIASGTPDQIRADAKVIAAYLGEEETDALSVRAVRAAEELSKPDAGALVPPSRPSLSQPPTSSGRKDDVPLLELSGEISPDSAQPMPLGRLEDLSKELVRRMERGLSKVDEIEYGGPPALYFPMAAPMIAAASPVPPVPPAKPSSKMNLSNVDRGWSSDAMPVAKPAVIDPSTPDLSKVDTGWGSEEKIPATEPMKKDKH
jgi:branched-chain amino acid transport system ATP-binding protein